MKTILNVRCSILRILLLCIFSILLTSCGKIEEAAPVMQEESAAQVARSVVPDKKSPTPQAIRPVAPAKPTPQADPLALVDHFLASMKSANLAFNSPQTINLNDTAQIQLLLSLNKSIEDLQREINSSVSGPREGASIKVANRMEARLTGPNFQITAITTEEQAIGANDTVEWRWEIKPLTTGRHNLHLTLTAIFNVDGSTTRRSLRTFDKSIEVEVTTRQIAIDFIEKYWQWILVAVLWPIASWIWKRWASK